MKHRLRQPVLFILIYTLVGFLTPLILKYAVFENQVYSHLSNYGGAGFLGSYVGGVLGGLGTLIAMYVTMKHSIEIQAENKRDTDQQIQAGNLIREKEYQRDKAEREKEYQRDKAEREAERKAEEAGRECEIRAAFANEIAEMVGKYITYISKYYFASIHAERLDEELRDLREKVKRAEENAEHAVTGATKDMCRLKLESARIRLDKKEQEVRENRTFGNRLDANEAYFIIKTKLFGNPDAEKLVHFMEEFHRETGIPQRAAECGLWLDESTEKLMGLFEEFRERYVRGEAAGETPDIWKKPV